MDHMSGWVSSPEPVQLHGEDIEVHQIGQTEDYCLFCICPLPEETETSEEYESLSICHDCKIVFLDGLHSDTQHRHWRRHHNNSRDNESSDSDEEIFSHRFSRLVNQVRQNNLDTSISGSEAGYHQYNDIPSTNTPNSSRNVFRARFRRQRALSDNSSDTDFIFEESDATSSICSFGAFSVDGDAVLLTGNGVNSGASLDGQSLSDGETYEQHDDESLIDDESQIGSDTDVDPMCTGLDHWDSDEVEEDVDEEGYWEEADVDQEAMDEINVWVRGATNTSEADPEVGSQESGSFREERDRDLRYTNVSHDNYGDANMSTLFIDFSVGTEVSPFVGNTDDYLGEGEFEELLNRLAETEGTLRGAPPAAESVLRSLPQIIINELHEKHGVVICAVCKDPMFMGTEANQLPCLHLYHPCCILPWLSTRNSCPICRYELLTDDKDYEEGKRIATSLPIHDLQQLESSEDSSSVTSDDVDVDETDRINLQWHPIIGTGFQIVGNGELIDSDTIDQRIERTNVTDEIATSNGATAGRRWRGWLLFAAAPIASIVGIVLVLWFRNPLMEASLNRIISLNRNVRLTDQQQHDVSSGRSATLGARGTRNWNWWYFF